MAIAKTDKSTSTSLIPNERVLVESGMNVMLIGPHGTGKTESILSLGEKYDLKVKVYNCATLDPFTDLIGVPMPQKTADGDDVLKMVRPRDLDEADMVFFDELPRARPETRNAVFEIINNRTINGEPLPKLKASWAAMNPPGDVYDGDALDPALMDRFDVFLPFEARPSVDYMQGHMDRPVAQALFDWWTAHNKDRRDTYISPRRLVKIGRVYMATRDKRAVVASLPPGGTYDHGKLWQMLTRATAPKSAAPASDIRLPKRGSGRKKTKIRSLATLQKEVPAVHKIFALGMATVWNSRPETFRELDTQCSQEELEAILHALGPAKRSVLRSCFASCMGSRGEYARTYCTWDGRKNPDHKVLVRGLTTLHAAINATSSKAARLPALDDYDCA